MATKGKETAAAREHALARLEGEAPESIREATRSAYRDVFSTDSARVVLEDLIRAYHDRTSPLVEEAVATIDHPYRTYYVEGQRSVVLALRDLAEDLLRGDET